MVAVSKAWFQTHLIEVKQLQLSPDAFKVPQGYEIQDIENAFIVE